MLVFFSFGSGRGRASFNWLGLIPILLHFGLPFATEVGKALIEPLVGLFSFGHSTSSQSSTSRTAGTSFISQVYAALTSLSIIAISLVCILHGILWVRRNGGLTNVRRSLQQALFPGQGQPIRQQGAALSRAQRVNVDAVASAIQKLPTDTYKSSKELESCSIHDLKEHLRVRGLDARDCVEKQELLQRINEHGGSSASACSICCEDYESGDAMRLLPCKHAYHIECIDQWFYKATDYSRPPSCPLCNAELNVQSS